MPPANPPEDPERVLQLVASGDITLPDLEVCWSCSRVPGRPLAKACYWWLSRVGYWLGLCARCCAIWRHDTAGEPALGPAQVTDRRPAA
jgi:hypothetical protein